MFRTPHKSDEASSGMETVKCHTWEEPSLRRIFAIRADELRHLWKFLVIGDVTYVALCVSSWDVMV